MGDDFLPSSPAPFGAVTEAALVRECERVLDRQNFGRVLARACFTAGVLEIDVVFPRNETYAPREGFPIVFAFRNAHLTQASQNLALAGPGNEIELFDTNWTSHEPYFVYGFADLQAREGQFDLFWIVEWISCDLSGPESAVKVNTTEISQRSIDFTIKSGGQAVDLVADTANNGGTCAQPGAAISVTDETVWVPTKPAYSNEYGNVTCAVEISSAAAESIWASLTAHRCKHKDANDTSIDWPRDNAAERSALASVACLAVAFGALRYLPIITYNTKSWTLYLILSERSRLDGCIQRTSLVDWCQHCNPSSLPT
ncbi:hypothetical protein N657DRAFT_661016 [Parathielavia appendiculata]|uniref:DUF7136 domain-containing protein n=1 Tax=Parathielavia appendiculata TaxID=2587402 RepID=A0AAN6Z9F8_9PEZI|nr:hypothetical protein N657DRAFT_661016 [Parathielavia appendiculata]